MKKLLTKLAILGLATATVFSFAACSNADFNGGASNSTNDGSGGNQNWTGPTAPEAPDKGDRPNSGNADSAEGGAGSGSLGSEGGAGGDIYDDGYGGNYVYNDIVEQDFVDVAETPASYFSLDRNTASYSQVRSQLGYGWKISPASVRVEELINYFDYDFEAPTESAVGVSAYLSDCPWNDSHKLMLAGVKTTEINLEDVNGNYVFLIDVSGSMSADNRIGLAKRSLKKLVDGLGDNDVVSIVTYASGISKVLDGGECTKDGKDKIKEKIDGLKASGATYASGGLELAYETAQKHFITGGNNRVIIISDGDFNVGISNTDTMMEYISGKAESGVYLSVFGVGMGNMRDDMLETLARNGNGNYAYLDNDMEAEKAFGHDLGGTLITVAKDAKAGVTFEDTVVKYRLIGYDTKLISEDQYYDDTTDTGEIGSNLCVAALYEIELAENAEGAIANVEVRYKDVTGEGEKVNTVSVEVTTYTPSSDDLSFAACVAEFGLVLRQSKYAENANLYAVLERLSGLTQYISADPYRAEFVNLVGKASEIYNKK